MVRPNRICLGARQHLDYGIGAELLIGISAALRNNENLFGNDS
jgi:hypothetical protein